MKKSKIFVVDRLVIGNNHVVFNSGFLSILEKIYPNDSIEFYSEETHSQILKEKLGGDAQKISFQTYKELTLPNNGLKKIFPWLRKKIKDLYFIRSIFKKIEDSADSIFFTTLSITSMFYANLLAKGANISIYFIIHGEVEFLFNSQLRKFDRVKKFIYLKFIQHLSPNVKLIVLSELVKESLINTGFVAKEKILLMRHPIMNRTDEGVRLNDKIIFGHIGTAMKKKSSELFFKIAQNFKYKYPYITFLQIGKIEADLRSVIGLKTDVDFISINNESISQDIYENNIRHIDYTIFTFDKENYVYRDSGAVMDAIAYCKPLIVLKQNFFDFLFEQGGNIGFMCDNFDQMIMVIEKIINKDPILINQYTEQCENLKKLRHLYFLSEVKKLLEKQLV